MGRMPSQVCLVEAVGLLRVFADPGCLLGSLVTAIAPIVAAATYTTPIGPILPQHGYRYNMYSNNYFPTTTAMTSTANDNNNNNKNNDDDDNNNNYYNCSALLL